MADKQKGMYFDGDVFIRRWVAGVLQNEVIGPLSGTKLGIKAQSEAKDNISKGRSNRGKKLDSVTVAKPTAFSIGFNRTNPKLLAMVFLGIDAVKTINAGTITAEPVILPHDIWVKVSERNISAVVIGVYVLNTDYEVDCRLGMIRSLSTGAITDGEAVTFNATFGSITSMQIKGGIDSKVHVEVVLDGTNLVDDSEVYIRIPKVPLTPDSDMDFLADDYITVEFSGEMEKLAAETAEFYVDTDVVLG